MKTLYETIFDATANPEDFIERNSHGEIDIKDYETFQYWLFDKKIDFDVLDPKKDKRNIFGNDNKCMISVSLEDHVNNKVSLIYSFINKGEYFWGYFLGDDVLYDQRSSCDLYWGDDQFIKYLNLRRQPFKYFREKIKKAERKRVTALKPKRDKSGYYTTNYYEAGKQESYIKEYQAIMNKMK